MSGHRPSIGPNGKPVKVCIICGTDCGIQSEGDGHIVIKPVAQKDEVMYVLDKRYYTDAQREKLYTEDENGVVPPEAAFLFGTPGSVVSEEEAKKFGLRGLPAVEQNTMLDRAFAGLPNRVSADGPQYLPKAAMLEARRNRTPLERVADAVVKQDEKAAEGENKGTVNNQPDDSPAARRAREMAQAADDKKAASANKERAGNGK